MVCQSKTHEARRVINAARPKVRRVVIADEDRDVRDALLAFYLQFVKPCLPQEYRDVIFKAYSIADLKRRMGDLLPDIIVFSEASQRFSDAEISELRENLVSAVCFIFVPLSESAH